MGLSKKYLAVSALFRPSLEDKMNAHSFFVLLTACFGLVSCSEVKFKDCGSKSGKPTHLYIDPCTSNPCALVKGKNSTISVSFIPNKAVLICKGFSSWHNCWNPSTLSNNRRRWLSEVRSYLPTKSRSRSETFQDHSSIVFIPRFEAFGEMGTNR